MLGLQAEDLSHTRFYQDVLQIGREEGEKLGESKLILRQLGLKFGSIDASLEQQVRALSSERLELLGEALLNFQNISELQAWLVKQN